MVTVIGSIDLIYSVNKNEYTYIFLASYLTRTGGRKRKRKNVWYISLEIISHSRNSSFAFNLTRTTPLRVRYTAVTWLFYCLFPLFRKLSTGLIFLKILVKVCELQINVRKEFQFTEVIDKKYFRWDLEVEIRRSNSPVNRNRCFKLSFYSFKIYFIIYWKIWSFFSIFCDSIYVLKYLKIRK